MLEKSSDSPSVPQLALGNYTLMVSQEQDILQVNKACSLHHTEVSGH